MKRFLKFFPIILLSLNVNATSVPEKPLAELVKESDHVILGTIVKVDMINGEGEAVDDKHARTGPNLTNEIRFHLEVKEVVFSKSLKPSNKVIVPLWSAWHYKLGDFDGLVGQTSFFLLKTNSHLPVYPAYFQRSMDEGEQIRKLVNSSLVTP